MADAGNVSKRARSRKPASCSVYASISAMVRHPLFGQRIVHATLVGQSATYEPAGQERLLQALVPRPCQARIAAPDAEAAVMRDRLGQQRGTDIRKERADGRGNLLRTGAMRPLLRLVHGAGHHQQFGTARLQYLTPRIEARVGRGP